MAQGTRSGKVRVTGEDLADAPEIDEAAELMKLAGNSTRLKLLYLLETLTDSNLRAAEATATD